MPEYQPQRNWSVVPDKVDLRDRPYMPTISVPPPGRLDPPAKVVLPILDQEKTSACTGFALATVVNFLLQRAGRGEVTPVSPFMLYAMARRYDEFPGWKEDSGSSLRGAIKGWFKHGVCRENLWRGLNAPKGPPGTAADDWWMDAVQRPLGAYYRVEAKSVSDMHVALNEVGILYASAVCHSGWDQGFGVRAGDSELWQIPSQSASQFDGGHAFAIVGYTDRGFIIQNSWGKGWGTDGRAILTYSDWLANVMDCWVTQIGVVTTFHQEMSQSASLVLGSKTRQVRIASDPVLRDRQISPYVINMENNGKLSTSGQFHTNVEDLQALVGTHMDAARRAWGVGANDPVDVAVYAHGGLTGEQAAAETAARWIPALYEARIFPIFLMWETDLWSTLKNRAADVISHIFGLRTTGGLRDWWNSRLENTLAPIGTMVWGEMKQNAEAITSNASSGVRLFYKETQRQPNFQRGRVRLHLIGHSAGSIVHSYIVNGLAKESWRFESVHFMAPAVRQDVFEKEFMPHWAAGRVNRYYQYHLTDQAENKDPTCKPILGYSRSLLYLVSESFEGGETTPILGMEKYFATLHANVGSRFQYFSGPPDTASTTHGDFDNDDMTMNAVIRRIQDSRQTASRAAGAGHRAARSSGRARRKKR